MTELQQEFKYDEDEWFKKYEPYDNIRMPISENDYTGQIQCYICKQEVKKWNGKYYRNKAHVIGFGCDQCRKKE